MLLGYARVSTLGQNLDRQMDSLNAAGCEKFFTDKATGTNSDRPELNKMLGELRNGDIVVIADLTRLSRSTKDLFTLVEAIEKKGANIRSLKEKWVDTTTPQGKLMFTIFSGISQFERDLISQRTKEGLEAAAARGRIGGRPRISDKQEKNLNRALELKRTNSYSTSEITEMTGISKATLYRYLKKSDAKENSIAKSDLSKIYQLKITLKDIYPTIWRRVLVPDVTFRQLHNIIQAAFGWDNFHLFEFNLGYGAKLDESEMCKPISHLIEFSDLFYTYDFGDWWEHSITVEKTIKPQNGASYPCCTGGKRNCPPEDVGGSVGYMHGLKVLKNRKYPEYRQYRELFGKGYDPEYFNLEQTNEQIKFVMNEYTKAYLEIHYDKQEDDKEPPKRKLKRFVDED